MFILSKRTHHLCRERRPRRSASCGLRLLLRRLEGKPPCRALGLVQLNSAFCTLNSALTCQRQFSPPYSCLGLCGVIGLQRSDAGVAPYKYRRRRSLQNHGIVQLKNKPVLIGDIRSVCKVSKPAQMRRRSIEKEKGYE